MKETYVEMVKRHSEEFNSLPIKFAFRETQFNTMLKEFKCKPKDLYSLGGGGYYKKTDSKLVISYFNRVYKEKKEAYEDFDFVYDAFYYELGNHEFGISRDIDSILDALDIPKSKAMEVGSVTHSAMLKAILDYLDDYEKQE